MRSSKQTNFKIFGEKMMGRQLNLDGVWAETKNWQMSGKGIWKLLRAKEISEQYAAYLLNTVIDYGKTSSSRARALKYWLKLYCIPDRKKIERCIYLYLSDAYWQLALIAWNYLKGRISWKKEAELNEIYIPRRRF